MLLTVSEFRNRVDFDLQNLVKDLQDKTGRRNPQEEAAWKASFRKVRLAFSSPSFDDLHLYFGERGNLSLEYRLPAASSWCDMVLLGSHRGLASVVIIELKDWQTRNDKPGPIAGIMLRHTGHAHHPSDQVKGYVNYCRRFHSAVLESKAQVHGCVLFTGDNQFSAYSQKPNDELFADFPAFFASENNTDTGIVRFFQERLTEPDPEFAESFEAGEYKQDRNFVRQMAEQIRDADGGPFELLDNQRLGLALCQAAIEESIFKTDSGEVRKTVIVVHGPPGSGKSVVAGKLWANLVIDDRLTGGNFVVTTTSKAQESNWRRLFEIAGKSEGAGGVVVAANKYAPENIPGLGKWMKKFPGKLKDPMNWRENCRLVSTLRGGPQMPDNNMLVSIVDEAHALMNPEFPDARTQSGWPVGLGPQAYHIIRSSLVSIFFLDGKQAFRERETTSIESIHTWAKELGATIVPTISLEGGQFRCAGSREFVDWVDSLYDFSGGAFHHSEENEEPDLLLAEQKIYGRKSTRIAKGNGLETRIFDSLPDMEAALRDRSKKGFTSRFAASFSRRWITKQVKGNIHDLPADMLDFQMPYEKDGRIETWSKPWNVVPGGDDYTAFIQGSRGTKMFEDPLSEVGCPYAIRGFDFDYIGLLWLQDLVWRNGKWIVLPKNVHETGLKRSVGRALKEKELNGPHHRFLRDRVFEAYRILMTRSIKGLFLWFEDEPTKDHISKLLGAEPV